MGHEWALFYYQPPHFFVRATSRRIISTILASNSLRNHKYNPITRDPPYYVYSVQMNWKHTKSYSKMTKQTTLSSHSILKTASFESQKMPYHQYRKSWPHCLIQEASSPKKPAKNGSNLASRYIHSYKTSLCWLS